MKIEEMVRFALSILGKLFLWLLKKYKEPLLRYLCSLARWFRLKIIRRPRITLIVRDLNGEIEINYEAGLKSRILASEDELKKETTKTRQFRCKILGHNFVTFYKNFPSADMRVIIINQEICRVCLCDGNIVYKEKPE